MRIKALLSLAVGVVVVLGAVGCGSSSKASGSSSASAAKLKVGLVTDVGGLHDRGFNQLSYEGLKRAEAKLGVDGRVLLSKSNSDYVPNLTTLARQHYGLIVAVGFLMTDAVDEVAPHFPKTKFAIIDVDATQLKNRPKNVEGLLFREQQGGYLIGYLAGLVAKHQGGKQVVGVVAGMKIPPVDRFAAGYEAGAKKADPGVKVLLDYSQDFVREAKCKELALNHIAAGSQVEFADAGACGLGVHDAAREHGIWSLGGDADQSYLGPEILSSELKKVDVAVYDLIQRVRNGAFRGGRDSFYSVQNGGVGIGKISPKVPQSIDARLQAVKARLAAGKIKDIPTAP
jgi:basic membrane protein A